MSFGKKLKSYRKINNLTQEELAKKLNTTKQIISKYENEQRIPNLLITADYSNKLKIPLDVLADVQIYSCEKSVFLSAHEKELLLAYRNQHELQKQVDELLKI